jgi:SPW repeat
METQRPNWLAGQDFTTFANERRPSGNQVSPDPPQRAARTGRADALVFLAAVWLVIASVSVAYQSTGRFDVLWNDAVVGIAVGVVTVTRLAGAAMPATAAVNCALGAWLVVAPFVLGYGGGGAGRLSLWNDLAVGIVIVALTLATMATATARAATAKAPGPKSPEVEPHRRP